MYIRFEARRMYIFFICSMFVAPAPYEFYFIISNSSALVVVGVALSHFGSGEGFWLDVPSFDCIIYLFYDLNKSNKRA